MADPFQQMQINVQGLRKNTPNAGDAAAQVRSIDVLKNISENIPDEIAVVFERMVIGSDSVLISGTTAAFNSVDVIKGRLERIAGKVQESDHQLGEYRSFGQRGEFQIKVDLGRAAILAPGAQPPLCAAHRACDLGRERAVRMGDLDSGGNSAEALT